MASQRMPIPTLKDVYAVMQTSFELLEKNIIIYRQVQS